jgi:hypothetical protein
MVQIANHFGTAHLRTDLENARDRMANLISLHLENHTGGDLQLAALAIRDKSFLSLSKGGSDLLKILHAMPITPEIGYRVTQPEDEKNFLNEKTLASPMLSFQYQTEQGRRSTCQRQIALACWLARRMGLSKNELESASPDAELVIRSALLVLFVKEAKLELPGRTGLVKLLDAARKKTSKLDEARLNAFLAQQPNDFVSALRTAMKQFVAETIPQLRNSTESADYILNSGNAMGIYFINENITEDLGAYDRLVAKEWHLLTKGDDDDDSVIATIFLFIATGLPPKASALKREAKEIISAFRKSGFNSDAVLSFIEAHAPYQMREHLVDLWQKKLKHEAEIHLSDLDPQMPDSYMDRALFYFKETCNTSWKGRGRN